MLRFAILTVNAGEAATVSAISRAVSSSAAAGTTRDTTPCRSASSASITRPVRIRSIATPWPHIWNRRAMPPVSVMTPCFTSGSMKRVPSAQMRMSATSERSKEPPITQPLSAHTTGTWRSRMRAKPCWPRSMNERLSMSSVRTPICSTSRPDDQLFPFAFQITARTSLFAISSSMMSRRRASISSFAALCLSGRLFVMTAIGPS